MANTTNMVIRHDEPAWPQSTQGGQARGTKAKLQTFIEHGTNLSPGEYFFKKQNQNVPEWKYLSRFWQEGFP